MSNHSTPEDTTKRDALDHFAGVLGGTERYIDDMNADGQRQVVASTALPTKSNYSTDEDFAALGFKFGPVCSDPMFREATLPDGWRREGSEHAMWSYILDERGIRRVSVFYKAAFYDREAFMGIINVGGDVATHWIYGDEKKPKLNPALTADELADAKRSAENYLSEAERYPSREDRVPRAQSLVKAVDAVLPEGVDL